jgi:hypothetical protein
MKVGILGVGLLSAGLDGWANGRDVLAGRKAYAPNAWPNPEAALLPSNERRRSSDSVRWAVHVAQEAMVHSGLDPREVATIFASSGGEMGVLDALCRTLATTDRAVSPTLFHQSVHNAAAGYWGIATGCQQSSTALSCHDDSCAVGLLEAVTYATTEERPVLFVSYDLPPPAPLNQARPLGSAFATALVMTPFADGAPARVAMRVVATGESAVTPMPDGALEHLRRDNPAARLLPVLLALARRGFHSANVDLLNEQRLAMEIQA